MNISVPSTCRRKSRNDSEPRAETFPRRSESRSPSTCSAGASSPIMSSGRYSASTDSRPMPF